MSSQPLQEISGKPRHAAWVRVTHWITVVAFVLLLVTGVEIVISHPRFYWGEAGNVNVAPLFTLPIPSSRGTVPTGYHFVMPDQNGWSRYLHFEMAWVAVLTGLVYGLAGLWTRHFQRNLLPAKGARNWRALWDVGLAYVRGQGKDSGRSYNAAQRVAYSVVVFGLFPLVIWTGLAMSPAVTSAMPWLATLLGGRQSARTIHFVVSVLLSGFVVVHVAMVAHAGFVSRMRAMITGRVDAAEEGV